MFIENTCMGPISCACVQAQQTRNDDDDDDRHTCACLFIVSVHLLKRTPLTLFGNY